MAESASPQRAWRAACPGCGAPVEFKFAQSTHAVCGYCQSTVVRSGEVLKRIGKMAELFDDHSPLQLGASGTYKGRAFTLVGRLQFKGSTGVWAEWEALCTDGTLLNLAEDNGAYVMARALDTAREAPAAEHFRLGATTAVNGKPATVTLNDSVALISAQGELPKLPPLGQPFAVVELRTQEQQVISIEYSSTPPRWSVGEAVALADLAMSGLKTELASESKGRQFSCPNCGASVGVSLASSKSVVCGSCDSIIDLNTGIGGELTAVKQDEHIEPLIPMGSSGKLQNTQWQVVGFQHRLGVEPGSDEHFGWDEYLLFEAKRGFVFLVDSTEGWSLVKPTTGVPKLSANGSQATYLGGSYMLTSTYKAETTYVCGEFYWPVFRGQVTQNRDFARGRDLLSLEQSDKELNWSAGSKLDANTVVQAFGLKGQEAAFKRSDVTPVSFSGGNGMSFSTLLTIFVILIILASIMNACGPRCDPSREDCSAYTSSSGRSSGGSWGGGGSIGGGGHK